jgi:hypothetical protein
MNIFCSWINLFCPTTLAEAVMSAVEPANNRGVTTFLVALQRDHVRIAVDYSCRVNNPGSGNPMLWY